MQLELGTARPLAKTFDVKKRVYYGNTSMEAEMSLLMANQTLVCLFSHPYGGVKIEARYLGISRKTDL